jgi:hypothetical protein
MTTSIQWWQWGTVQHRLQLWTKALLQGRVYRVILDPAATDTAYEDSVNRRIVANPQAFGANVVQQYRATRGLLAHEAGHALYTDAWPEGGSETALLRGVVNDLEDARVEGGMCNLYPGVTADVRFLGDLAWDDNKTKTAGKAVDDAARMLGACLLWRWACDREGHEAMASVLGLAGDAEQLWLDEVRPLVEEAWTAPDTHKVIGLARRILEILDLPEGWELPDWLVLLLPQDGVPEEREGEAMPLPAGAAGASASSGAGEDENGGGGPALPAGALERPWSKSERETANEGGAVRIPPAPYLSLEAQARPLAAALVAELQPPRPDRRPMPHPWRGRYSFREEMRDEERPFLLGQARASSAEGLAMQVLADRSGSMRHRMPDVQVAAMALNLACRDLRIPLAITVFGGYAENDSWRDPLNVVTIQEFGEEDETPKARIAALMGHTQCEHLILALRERGPELAARPEGLRLLVVVHDGYPVYEGYPDGNDWDLSLDWLRDAPRLGITPVGVLLVDDPVRDESYAQRMRALFEWLIVCRSQELPGKIGNLLRCLV